MFCRPYLKGLPELVGPGSLSVPCSLLCHITIKLRNELLHTIIPPNGYHRKSYTHKTALIVRISNHLKGSCSFTLKQAPNFRSLPVLVAITRLHTHTHTQWILRQMNFFNALYSKDPRNIVYSVTFSTPVLAIIGSN